MLYKNKNLYKKEYDDTKIEYIQIRVTAEEKQLFKTIARLQCLSVSSLVRWLVLSKYKNELFKDAS